MGSISGLRLEVGGRVAQIDHLLINRLLDTWVLESRHFAEGVSINDLSLSGPASPAGARTG